MPRYIDETEIYRLTDGGKDIFAYYFPDYRFGDTKAFVKDRPDEKTASAKISYYNGSWRITDFGNEDAVKSLKGVAYVMHRENLAYYEALLFIESVVVKREVSGTGYVKPSWKAEYSFREMEPGDEKGKYNFAYKSEPSEKDLQAIGPFVTAELLKKYDCKAVEYYEYCSFSKHLKRDVVHIFKSTDDYPIFVFDYGQFKKLYRPHEMDKAHRFSYEGTKPADYVYGWKQLQGTKNEFADEEDEDAAAPSKENPSARIKDLFRCSGESDALNMASLGYHVYWLNSESANYGSRYKEIKEFCLNHFQIMDLDTTGKAMARKNALSYIDLYTMILPGWLSAKKDFRGNPCKDIKDFIAQYKTVDEAADAVRIYKIKSRRAKFWDRDPDKGTYSLNMEFFYHFLELNGFFIYKFSHIRNTDYCYVHIQDKIVDIIPPEQIKRIVKQFTKKWIKSKNLTDEISILNKLNTSNQISEANIEIISEIDIDFNNHDSHTEYLHFKNCSLRITPDEIKQLKHEQVPNYILGSLPVKGKDITQTIDFDLMQCKNFPVTIEADPIYADLLEQLRSAKKEADISAINLRIAEIEEINRYNITVNDPNFIFTNFLRDITRIYWRKETEEHEELTEEERKRETLAFANIMFCMGYLAAQYKNQGKPWLVFLQDMKISEISKASGRSGKSLITKALYYIRNCFYIGGRELGDQSKFQFIYDGFTEFHDIIEVDDLDEHASFSFFYTQVTGNRTINGKNTSPFVLEYKDSGKMIISSNFELPDTSASTLARILNAGVSDYYHEATKYNDYRETRTPLSKYGRQLYLDFTRDEWNQFYWFMAYCIQVQMRFDKINPPMDNLEKRQYRREMSSGLGRGENFLYWANDYFRPWEGPEDERPTISGTNGDDMEDSTVYLNTMFLKREAIADFQENSGIPDSKRRNFNAQNFKDKLRAWCNYNEYEMNPLDVCTDEKNHRIMKKNGKKVEEYIYIRAKQPASPPVPPMGPDGLPPRKLDIDKVMREVEEEQNLNKPF